MRVWRLTKPRYAASAFNGEGAKLAGGRWNHTGTAATYTSDSAALATLEALVRLQDTRLLRVYGLVNAEVPDDAVEDLDTSTLNPAWRDFPHSNVTKEVGHEWLLSGRSLGLRVPSVVVAGHNVLLNPGHARFPEIQTFVFDPAPFDVRLIGG